MSGPQLMSVFARGRRTRSLTAGACIRLTGNDSSHVAVARVAMHGGTAIATIDGHVSVIKQREEGDEKLTFDALFDQATSEHDIRKMAKHKVDTPDAIGKSLYLATVIMIPGAPLHARIAFAAADDLDAPRVLQGYLNQTATREELLKHFLPIAIEDEGTEIVTPGFRKIRETLPPGFNADKWLLIGDGDVPPGIQDEDEESP